MSEIIGKFIGDNLVSLVVAGISATALYYIRSMVKALAKNKKRHPLSNYDINIYGEIIELLTVALVKTKAARCYILSIRNGDVQIHNLHQYKLYCDYEITVDGISEMKQKLQAIPVQDVYECVALYYKKNTKVKGVDCIPACDCYIYNHDKLEPSTVKQMMVAAGSDITIHSVIRSATGEILGVVCLDYCSEKYDDFFKTNQAILVGELNDCRDRMQAVLRGYNENRPH